MQLKIVKNFSKIANVLLSECQDTTGCNNLCFIVFISY